jgi:hypothetical protein
MAARLRKMHQDDVRQKIRASQLINRLEEHALGEECLETSQVRAIEVLLKKVLPDLAAIELSGDADNPVETVTRIELVAPGHDDSEA